VFWVVPLGAQNSNGAVSGQVVDATTQQPLPNVEVSIVGTPHRELTKPDGQFLLSGLPAGVHRLRATRIGYGSLVQNVTVDAGQATKVQLTLQPAAAILEPVVVTGYGTQRREAITGSVATVDATAANVGVVTNADDLLRGRAAGVEITLNDGEPGAGAQILIRGGSSISASNDPLYVIDGVPINSLPTEQASIAVGSPPLARNPLNLLNPSDIQSMTVLKDASATAIYGSRASNGVVLIETKRGQAGGGPTIEYDGYVATSSPAKRLNVLNGAQYTAFVQSQVANWRQDSTAFRSRHPGADTIYVKHFADSAATFNALDPVHLGALGSDNTNWADAVTRTTVSHNQNLAFSGGNESTRYRASLNYAKEQGVALSSGLERIQGRISATHSDLNDRLRLGVNVSTSHVNNTYLTYDNNSGFQGGVFVNTAVFNPTKPIMVTDSTGTHYYESGSSSVWNPVAMAQQITDIGQTTRTLANANAELDVATGLTAKVNVGLDRSGGLRQEYYPNASPFGVALGGGEARQQDLELSTATVQTVLNYQRELGAGNTLDLVGGYEYSKFTADSVTAQAIGFFTDAFTFNNLSAATTWTSASGAQESRLASFFSRANVGFKDRFFLTGVLRYDGSSKFAPGHKWALFPALSGSWHVSQEQFLQNGPFSDLRVRLGWGLQGNLPPEPYSTLITLGSGGNYAWGNQPQGGVVPTSNGNPNLKWEQTSQVDGAIDFGLLNNRISGTIEYYVKNTKDLLLTVSVPQPALASTQLQNVGSVRNRGLEISLDAVPVSRPGLVWRAGLVFAAERNRVTDLGASIGTYIASGAVSGQGQSNQFSERIETGYPIGTFYGPVFVGVDANGRQTFFCTAATVGCVNGQTTTGGGPNAADYRVIGNANPDFTLGFHSAVNWGRWDMSFLVRAAVGQDVFNNTALVYSTKGNALQDKNFLLPALTDPIGIHEPAIFSSHWIESASFVRLQNITIGYDLNLPILARSARSARLYVSADNLVLLTPYSGLDPEVHTENGLATRGLDYLTYPRPRTVTGGMRVTF
jgi:iron complex outermembrane receptor protein